ncbi:MAG: type VI secretion system tip protein TssI/VgrG [Pseudomonadota bacterium]
MAGNRQVKIATPLGMDELLFSRMSGREEMGRLFEYEVVMYSPNPEINIDDILGQNVTIELSLTGGGSRYFNGFVTRFSQASSLAEGYSVYEATVSPWLWFLTRTADCRIFQEKSVPDIVKEVFSDNGFSDFEDKLTGTYQPWEYCVQYRETDFNFVSRLLEQEGIYYYFTHANGQHKLVLSDGYSSHAPIAGESTLPFHPPGLEQTIDMEHVSEWNIDREIQPGLYALTDYDFKRPKKNLLVNRKIARPHSQAEGEIFDYPGDYRETGIGEQLALARIEELHTNFEEVSGSTDARAMIHGCLFTLERHPRGDQNREYLITRANYELAIEEYASTGQGGEQVYMCSFGAVESGTTFRADRSTPKPVVQGPQTAVVVGPAGEEIFPDEFGRVKVQFPWDRYGQSDDKSSCWIRVAQSWAGPGWGAQFIPRIGQEVMVEFLEGDPDRPIITGRVYNADNMPPYSLPDNKTQSGVKSRSTKGAAASNFNEIRFEDKLGNEELYVQAEKDYNQLVKNDRGEVIGNDRSLDVGHDKSEVVGNNKSITVRANHSETIAQSKRVSVGVNHTETIGSNMSITVGTNFTEQVGVNYSETIGGAMQLTVGGALTETVGVTKSSRVGTDYFLNVGKDAKTTVLGDFSEMVLKSKSVSIDEDEEVKVGKNYVLDAGDQITIQTGKASITMKKDGTIVLRGKDITINGSGKVNVKAKSNLTLKGKKILEN